MNLTDETVKTLIKSIDLASATRDIWKILGEVTRGLNHVAGAIKSSPGPKKN
ncbi:MAG: hypothetical protein ABSH06_10095 [Thermodesulfobacteriota bacterium]|jgi:hypothetical protein